jgi:pimeloyl-ACP methyl ester carboxylesterase
MTGDGRRAGAPEERERRAGAMEGAGAEAGASAYGDDAGALDTAVGIERTDPGPMVWRRTWVQDRRASYAVIGHGLPVLFLHGWALGDHTYKGVIRRIAARGCRVYAPALPGFGHTPSLPSRSFSLAGYAAWAEEFIRNVGPDEPVVVVGHSFGGGVAIRLAHDFPAAVRALVLVNSIGGSAWRRGKTLKSMRQRPLWDWGLHFPGDVWPLPQARKVIPVMLEDAVTNIVRNPRALWKVGNLARGADLQPELEELKRRGLPVTVIWARRDGIIPRESFDALCVAVGATGRVVDGSHSWLLADPDAFSEVITNDLEVAKLARQLEADAAKAGEAPGPPRRLASLVTADEADEPDEPDDDEDEAQPA